MIDQVKELGLPFLKDGEFELPALPLAQNDRKDVKKYLLGLISGAIAPLLERREIKKGWSAAAAAQFGSNFSKWRRS